MKTFILAAHWKSLLASVYKRGELIGIYYRTYPNPTLFEFRKVSEPYSRRQWDSALKATPHSPKGDIWYVGAFQPSACSTAHGLQSRRPRSVLTALNLSDLG